MTLKTYQRIKLVAVVILAIFFSQAIYLKNFIIPIAVMVIASLILLFLRRRVGEIVADERDYATAGKAALLAMQIFSWTAAIGMFIFLGLKDRNPGYEPVAMTLAFSTCGLMLLYGVIFRYYNRFSLSENRRYYLAVAIVAMIFAAMFSVRILSGEDDWICHDGEWVKHGNPSFAAPSIQCGKTEQKPVVSNYRIEATTTSACQIDNDCVTPGEYLIRSNCPYTSKCVKNKCAIICPTK